MTDLTGGATGATTPSTQLSRMTVPQLQALAQERGLQGVNKLRKGDLIQALSGGSSAPREENTRNSSQPTLDTPANDSRNGAEVESAPASKRGGRRASTRGETTPTPIQSDDAQPTESASENHEKDALRQASDHAAGGRAGTMNIDDIQLPEPRETKGQDDDRRSRRRRGGKNADAAEDAQRQDEKTDDEQGADDRKNQNDGEQNNGKNRRRRGRNGNEKQDQSSDDEQGDEQNDRKRDRNGDRDRDRNGRNRNRKRTRDEVDPEVFDDDVLVQVAGILDVLDNYAFVRTTGYLAGPSDVYVSLGQVKKYNLRKGDAIVGAIRQPRENEQSGRQKYNAIVRIESVNGRPTDEVQKRVDFDALTALYPQTRLRTFTGSDDVTGRVVDLVSPIGLGQRGLVIAPPQSGKTTVLSSIASAIAEASPETHLMMVLVDARPEEVTEQQRRVKGEVIASTFDRQPEDHISIAELAIERAQRLVELGLDVVVLLDSLTGLGRAYLAAAAQNAKSQGAGSDVAALHPAKRLLAAARNVENGGSLTIIASALTGTSAEADRLVLEEFGETSNMELRLSRSLAERRMFPAVDVIASGTRRDELLVGTAESEILANLRTSLADLPEREALAELLDSVRRTSSNTEVLADARRREVDASQTVTR